MKAYRFLLPLITAVHSTTSAQIPPQTLEDSTIGWMKVYKFTGPRTPITLDGNRYSAVQLSIADSLANWMQASYTPRGALGDLGRGPSAKLGLYNKNEAAKPQTYGAWAHSFIELKYDANRKLVLYSNSHLTWEVRANVVFGEPALVLNTPTQHYFLMPGAGKQDVAEKTWMQRFDVSGHPALKRFNTYFNHQLRSTTANATYVVLSKDNKLPFVKISKAEYLDKLAGAVERKHAADREYAVKSWPEGKARVNALRRADSLYNIRLSLLENNRVKYAARLQEPAEVFEIQPSELLENYKDAFEGSGGPGERYPVYKVDPAMAELAKTDQPQWIVVWWDGDMLDPIGKQHHEAILNNFDFQYVYDYFFDPEKVKGRPYKPLRAPDFREPVVVTEASAAARANASDPNVYLFEDFSTTAVGRVPTAWRVGQGSGTVATLNGLPGNWMVMAGDASLTPRQLKAPLPQNFTLSFEVVAAQGFTWGARGLTLQLSHEKTPGTAEGFLTLKLRPGYDGKDGEASVETKFPAGYPSVHKWHPAPGFSNNKPNNHIKVSIRKSGEAIQVFIGALKIADFEKAIPPGLVFNAMSFVAPNSVSVPKDRYYLGNIRISRD